MKKTTYQSYINKILDAPQILGIETTNDKIIIKMEDTNEILL